MTRVTISFKAKHSEFSGGTGYKVPSLTPAHLSYDRAKAGTTLTLIARDPQRYAERIARTLGMQSWPGVVWDDGGDRYGISTNHPGWTVAPLGNGFMAQLSIEVDL